jgi:hypothetical protein
LLQHSVFTSKDEKLLRIFIYCLLRASHKETVVYFNHQDISLNPGQFITSREHAARDLGYGPKTFDRKIDDLQKLGILTRSTTRRFSIISLTNWSCYQNLPDNRDPVLYPGNDPLPGHKQEERKKKTTLRTAPDPRIKDFISFWVGIFNDKFGTPYLVNGGKEGALVKRLLVVHSFEKLQDMAALFFKSEDPFIQKSGYTIGAFSAQINKLATIAMRKSKW